MATNFMGGMPQGQVGLPQQQGQGGGFMQYAQYPAQGQQQAPPTVTTLPAQQGGYDYSPAAIPPVPQVQQPAPAQQYQAQPGYPQQQGGYPVQQAPAQAPAQQGIDLNQRLSGPNVPQALQGRTLQEAIAIHESLRQDWQRRAITPPQPPVQQQGGYNQQQGQGQQIAAQSGNFWSSPEERISQIVQQQVQSSLAPVLAQTQQQQILAAHSTFRQTVGDAQFLEPYVAQMLQGSDAETLANPEAWSIAADAVRGRLVLAGQYTPQTNGSPQMGQVGMPGGRSYDPSQIPSVPASQPQQYGFFTEASSAPNYSQMGAGAQVSQKDLEMAHRFGMPPAQYMQWKTGMGGSNGAS